ncbi:MAG: hypothetical protein K0R15_496 [Clostridiales bacterium]|nr:hypothetical protein [Clostridiales bacterium]
MTKRSIFAVVGVTAIVVIILSYISIQGINKDVNDLSGVEGNNLDKITETIYPKDDDIISAAITTITPVVEKIKTTSDTIFVTKKYYNEDEKVVEEETGIPYYLTGMTEDELFDYTKNYMRNPNLSDRNQNIIEYSIESFSSEKVVLKKIYESINKEEYYYVTITDNYITIYKNDKVTLKETTGISVEQLNSEIVSILLEGVTVYGEQGIIELLENFTS